MCHIHSRSRFYTPDGVTSVGTAMQSTVKGLQSSFYTPDGVTSVGTGEGIFIYDPSDQCFYTPDGVTSVGTHGVV